MRKREPLKSPVREIRTPGSVRGPLGNRRSYRDGDWVDRLALGRGELGLPAGDVGLHGPTLPLAEVEDHQIGIF